MSQSREPLELLLEELIVLRRAVAAGLGRQQYLYDVIDAAVERRHEPALRHALDEFAQQPPEVREQVLDALEVGR